MKRVYSAAGVDAVEGGYCVTLDTRPLRTPARAVLVLPRRALAEAVAAEWAAQAELVRPHTMPLMRLAATAVDRIAPEHETAIDQIAAYATSDLVCYRAETPADLVARQTAAWQPLVKWAAEALAAELVVTRGVVPVTQPPTAMSALRAAVARHEPMAMAALQQATTATGSLVIGLALAAGRLDAGEAHDAGQVDETFQAEHWGEDAEAAGRRAALKDDIAAAARFLELLRAA